METMIKGKAFVAVDFDGTITTEKDDKFGKYYLQPYCKETLLMLHDTGKVHLGLWTCRTGDQLDRAIDFLEEIGLIGVFETINGSFPEVDSLFGSPSGKKISADFYLDDRALGTEINWELFGKMILDSIDYDE